MKASPLGRPSRENVKWTPSAPPTMPTLSRKENNPNHQNHAISNISDRGSSAHL